MKQKTIYAFIVSAVFSISLSMQAPVVLAEQVEATQAVSPKVGNKLYELQTLVQAKKYTLAVSEAQAMLTWNNLTAYELVQINNFLAFAYYQAENIPAAIVAYENLAELGDAVPQGIMESTLEILAKLCMQQGEFNKALAYTNRLFGVVVAPTAELYYLRASVQYQAKQFSNTAADMVSALDLLKAQNKTPKENWLSLWNSANYEAGDYEAMTRSLRELIRYYPKDSYLMHLAGAYSQAGDTKKQLAIMDALYSAGIKTDAEFAKTVAMLNLQEGIPARAAQIFEKEMNAGILPKDIDNMTLMANAWFEARIDNKAVTALKQAANLSDDPDLYLRLGMAHYNLGQYEQAIKQLQDALGKGVEDRDVARQMIGLAYLELENFEKARDEFSTLNNATGRRYLAYIDTEIVRKEQLRQDVQTETYEKDELLNSLKN